MSPSEPSPVRASAQEQAIYTTNRPRWIAEQTVDRLEPLLERVPRGLVMEHLFEWLYSQCLELKDVAEARGRQQAEQARDEQLAEKEMMFAEFRDEWFQLCKEQRERAEAAESRVAALTQALKDYGRHDETCDAAAWEQRNRGYKPNYPRPNCSCGLDAALTGAQA